MSTDTTWGRIRASIAAIERRQWVIGGLSVLMTFIVMFTFLIENRYGYLKPDPIIAYFKNWEDGRSRDEALAEQAEEREMQAQSDAVAAELDTRAEEIVAEIASTESAAPAKAAAPAEPKGPPANE